MYACRFESTVSRVLFWPRSVVEIPSPPWSMSKDHRLRLIATPAVCAALSTLVMPLIAAEVSGLALPLAS